MFKECSRLNFVRKIQNESHRTLFLFLKCFDVLWDGNQGTSSGLTTHNWHQRSLWDSEITRTEASGMPSTGQCTTCPLSPVSLYSRFQMIIGFPVSHSEEHVSKLDKITHMFFCFFENSRPRNTHQISECESRGDIGCQATCLFSFRTRTR